MGAMSFSRSVCLNMPSMSLETDAYIFTLHLSFTLINVLLHAYHVKVQFMGGLMAVVVQ